MGKFSRYKVELASLPEGSFSQDFVCDTEFFKNMEKPEVIDADVKVHLDLIHKNDVYDCSFTCKGMLHIPCDRCLDPMEHEIDTTYHLTVKYGDSYVDETDDLLVIPRSDLYLNVAYMLADTILLTIPLRHVHAPGKCNRAMAEVLNRHSYTSDEETDQMIEESEVQNESED